MSAGRALLAFAAWAAVLLISVVAADADRAILDALRLTPAASAPLRSAALNLTALGSVAVLWLIVLAAAGFLALRHQPRMAALLLVSTLMGEGATELIKSIAARARPPSAAVYDTFGASFPSGHALLSAVVYLTLGALLASAERDALTRLYLIALAIGLTLLVGLTRLALGVHWLSDVLAGWSLGAAWAAAASTVAAWLQRTGAAEPAA